MERNFEVNYGYTTKIGKEMYDNLKMNGVFDENKSLEDSMVIFSDYVANASDVTLQMLSNLFVREVDDMSKKLGILLVDDIPITEIEFKFLLNLYNLFCERGYIDSNIYDQTLGRKEIDMIIFRLKDMYDNINFVQNFDSQMEYIFYMMRLSLLFTDSYKYLQNMDDAKEIIKDMKQYIRKTGGRKIIPDIPEDDEENIDNEKNKNCFSFSMGGKNEPKSFSISKLKDILKGGENKRKLSDGAYERLSKIFGGVSSTIPQNIIQTSIQNLSPTQMNQQQPPIQPVIQQQSVTLPLKK